ncbi:MAG: hypothetical protein WC374_01190 [Phycisphaerae bacterium]
MSLQNGKKNDTAVLLNAAIICVIVLLGIFFFANAMTKELGHDEHMYCTAGFLTAQGKLIYRDFSYVAQLPYHPLVLAAIYKTSGKSYYLLAGRVFSVACEIGILICIAGISRSVLKEYPKTAAGFAIAAMLLYSMNPFVIYASGFAWNHSMVILCVLICLWLYTNFDIEKTSFWRLFSMGAILTLATFTRPTTALIYAVFAVAILLAAPARLKKSKATALPFMLGTFAAAIWPIAVMIKAPEALVLNVIRIPALNATFLREAGWIFDKTQLTITALLNPAYVVLIILLGYVAFNDFLLKRFVPISGNPKKRLFYSMAAAFIVIAFIPPTMWLQYWAAPAAFIIVSLAYPLKTLCDAASANVRTEKRLVIAIILMVTAALLSIYVSSPSIAFDVINSDNWIPLSIHKISKDINKKIVADGPILTLSPLYAIEGGGDIYPQFSAGPFVYRIADKLSAEQKNFVHAAGTFDLPQIFDSNPPAAVIIGDEPQSLEDPIFEQVTKTPLEWEKKIYTETGPVVYFRNRANEE